MPVLVEDSTAAFEADLYLPRRPWGALIFAPAREHEAGFAMAMLESACALELAVIIPQLHAPEDDEDAWPSHEAGEHLSRLAACSRWLGGEDLTSGLAQGLFASGPFASAALRLCAGRISPLQALVVYEGRADMSEADLEEVRVPSLFVADGEEALDTELHEAVASSLHCESRLILLDSALVPPGAAVDWFADHFKDFYRDPNDIPSSARARGLFHDISQASQSRI
jgi:hypothetical protein